MKEMQTILFRRLSETAKVPTRATSGAAGYDIYSDEDAFIPAHGQALIETSIAIALPEHPSPDQIYYMRIEPRSGIAVRDGVTKDAGIIDSDYRGSIKVLLVNRGDADYPVVKGMRIAQGIIESCHIMKWVEVDELPPTDRGAGGFGSTGA